MACESISVDDSLRRMKTDYLDVLLLHRPDLIFEPEQVAEAFDILEKAGKVRYFGVSNVPTLQMELLRKFVRQPLVFNQLQFSLEQSQLIDQALYLNNKTTDMSIDRDNGTLDYCRLHDITVQAWSPLQHGFFKGCFVDDPESICRNQRERLKYRGAQAPFMPPLMLQTERQSAVLNNTLVIL